MSAARRFVRTPVDRPGREVVSERHVKRLLSPAEIRLLDVRPVTTILSTYREERAVRHLSKAGLAVKKHEAKSARHLALVTINAHHLAHLQVPLPTRLDPAGLRELNETLVLWTRDWLDALADDLTGQKIDSKSREAATRRCVEVIEIHAGVTFPEPRLLTSEGLHVNDKTKPGAKTNPLRPVAAAMAKLDPQAAKKAQAKKPAKKAVAKKKPGKPAITPNLGRAPAGAKKAKGREHDGDGDKLTVVQKEPSPAKKGNSLKYFKMMLKAKTVGEYRKLGGNMAYLRDDIGRGYVRRG